MNETKEKHDLRNMITLLKQCRSELERLQALDDHIDLVTEASMQKPMKQKTKHKRRKLNR